MTRLVTNGIFAQSIDCPKGHAIAGAYCYDLRICQARSNAAATQTRDANKLRRSSSNARTR